MNNMEKKIPLRTCIVCRESKPKKELVRIVKNADGVFVDETGRANGRGAYICKSAECAEKLKKSKALSRAFKCEVDGETYDKITEFLVGKKD